MKDVRLKNIYTKERLLKKIKMKGEDRIGSKDK